MTRGTRSSVMGMIIAMAAPANKAGHDFLTRRHRQRVQERPQTTNFLKNRDSVRGWISLDKTQMVVKMVV